MAGGPGQGGGPSLCGDSGWSVAPGYDISTLCLSDQPNMDTHSSNSIPKATIVLVVLILVNILFKFRLIRVYTILLIIKD